MISDLGRTYGVVRLSLFWALVFAASEALTAGKILSVESWSDPSGFAMTPYKIERLKSGDFVAFGWGQKTPREQFWIVKGAGRSGVGFRELDRVPFEPGLQKHARGFVEVPLRGARRDFFVTGLDAEQSPKGVLYFALVRKSSDGGRSWKSVDRYQVGTFPFTGTTDMTTDYRGNLYYVGHGCESIDIVKPKMVCRWFVRHSGDRGITWRNIDEVSSPEVPFWEPQKVRVDAAGRIVVAGFYSPTNPSDERGGVVRVYDPRRRRWSNVDLLDPKTKSSYWDVVVLPSREIIATGLRTEGGKQRWVVRKSDPSGRNWRTVDGHLCASGGGSSRAFPIAVLRHVIFVGGFKQCEGHPKPHLVIRRSIDGGASWTTVLDLERPEGLESMTDLVPISFNEVMLTGRLGQGPAGAIARARLESGKDR